MASLDQHTLALQESEAKVITLPSADCLPVTVAPGLSRLFLDFCAAAPTVRPFYASTPFDTGWQKRLAVPSHWPELVSILAGQNPAPAQAGSLKALSQGAGTVVTGQQVGLFGGPLFTPLKAATAIARARQATEAGHPHVPIFWLASEDHDFAEINHVVFPARRELRKLVYAHAPTSAIPVGRFVIDDSINELLDQAGELLGYSDTLEALTEAYRPGRTFARAFAEFYSKVFAAQGLLVFDADSRAVHRLGAPVLRAALEQADELHAALSERDRELHAAGYHSQVAVLDRSSLLFLIDEKTSARLALKRVPPGAAEPNGLWQAGRDRYSTEDLLAILASEPERISPSALLRPVFQDLLLSTSLTIGGPAEIAYFAQSAVLFERILGRKTPAQPRFSATLIEPGTGELLTRHHLRLEQIFTETQESLTQLLAAQAMPIEGKHRLDAAGRALESELAALLDWTHTLDDGLGRSAETAASKMRYQMNRLRRLAANFQLQREESLSRHAEALHQALYPGTLQERLHGAAWYFARHGFELAEDLVVHAGKSCAGHSTIWL